MKSHIDRPKTGLVFCAWRHGDCYTALMAWAHLFSPKERRRIRAIDRDQLRGSRQGFLTSHGRFVDRAEAARIALDAGQVDMAMRELTSEDLR